MIGSNSYFFWLISGKTRTHTAIILQNTEALGMLASDTDTIFLDGTFHICPINFTQVLNIAADINGRVTLLFSIPMTSKVRFQQQSRSFSHAQEWWGVPSIIARH
jgi:hypothetical protein